MNPYDEIASEVALYLLDNGEASPETAMQHGRAIVELICDVSPSTSDQAGETIVWDGTEATGERIAEAFTDEGAGPVVDVRMNADREWHVYVRCDGEKVRLPIGWRIRITPGEDAPFVVIPPATPATKDN